MLWIYLSNVLGLIITTPFLLILKGYSEETVHMTIIDNCFYKALHGV